MPRKAQSPLTELDNLFDNSVKGFIVSLNRIIRAKVEGSLDQEDRALEKFADLIVRSMALADILGRRRIRLETESEGSGSSPLQFGAFVYQDIELDLVGLTELPDSPTPVVPNVPFEDAIQNIVDRNPILAPSAELVAQAYSRDMVFALARSSDITLTERIRQFTQRSIREGRPVPDAAETIQGMGDFSRAYAETVYRTNLNTAYTAGRFQEAQDPDVKPFAPAFQYIAISDADVRRGQGANVRTVPERGTGENHLALDGLIAATDDAIWNTFAPPNGYNCRCTIRLIFNVELRRRGIDPASLDRPAAVPAGTAIHPNFALGRPDAGIYGAGAL